MADSSNEIQPLAGSLIGLYLALDRVYEEASREVGLSPQQAQLLCAADWKSPALGELANALHCDKTNITGLVDRVERQDLVERLPDSADRRVTRLGLTAKGKVAVDRFHGELNRRLAGVSSDSQIDAAAIMRIAEQLACGQQD